MKKLMTDEWMKISEKIQAGEKIDFEPARRPNRIKKEPDKPVYASAGQLKAVRRNG
jgi:hypothetical protein